MPSSSGRSFLSMAMGRERTPSPSRRVMQPTPGAGTIGRPAGGWPAQERPLQESAVSNRLVRRLWPALVFLCGSFAAQAQAQVTISQFYGAGGNSGAVLTNDYVELFNRGNQPESLAGLRCSTPPRPGPATFGANANLLVALPMPPAAGPVFPRSRSAGGANGAPCRSRPMPPARSTCRRRRQAGAGRFHGQPGCNGSNNPCSPEQLALILDLSASATPISTTAAARPDDLGHARRLPRRQRLHRQRRQRRGPFQRRAGAAQHRHACRTLRWRRHPT